MSTKSTLRRGPNFCLWAEGFEKDAVYLELNHGEFCATDEGVKIKIPIAVWEYLREVSVADFSLAKLSDQELRRLVAKQQKVQNSLPREDSLLASLGFAIWGEGTAAQKFRNAFSWHRKERARQRKIMAEIEALRSDKKKTRSTHQKTQSRGRKRSMRDQV